MRVFRRQFLILGLFLAFLGAGALWVTSSLAASSDKPTLPEPGVTAACAVSDSDPLHEAADLHEIELVGMGKFKEATVGEPIRMMVEVKPHYKSKSGLKTVPFNIVTFGGRGFAEGLGETNFWLDATRPVESAIWEQAPSTEFPAIQEMRFHVFYTVEALPGKVLRSINPVIMRSGDVRAFPPPPYTVYKLVKPVELEDVQETGVVVARLLTNTVVIPRRGLDRDREPREQ
jgi:hypothetical protein